MPAWQTSDFVVATWFGRALHTAGKTIAPGAFDGAVHLGGQTGDGSALLEPEVCLRAQPCGVARDVSGRASKRLLWPRMNRRDL
jgi:hypothetical protein